jgi:peptide methionine sulfoxide reductase MsrB
MTKEQKSEFQQAVTLDDRRRFFENSVRPIDDAHEEAMEQMSLAVTQEHYGNDFWEAGDYHCARCKQRLYTSGAKFSGPCIWPSFREGATPDALATEPVTHYNNYTCSANALYCGGCDLFIG